MIFTNKDHKSVSLQNFFLTSTKDTGTIEINN